MAYLRIAPFVCLGILIAILAALVPLSEIVKLVNIGTLFAFVLVNVGVIVLRYTKPCLDRSASRCLRYCPSSGSPSRST